MNEKGNRSHEIDISEDMRSKIKDWQNQNNLKVQSAAIKCNLSLSSYKNIIYGKQKTISQNQLKEIARAMRVTPLYLKTQDDDSITPHIDIKEVTITKEIRGRIRKHQNLKNWNDAEAAYHCGINESAYVDIFDNSDVKNLRIDTLYNISRALDVSLAYLINKTNNPKEELKESFYHFTIHYPSYVPYASYLQDIMDYLSDKSNYEILQSLHTLLFCSKEKANTFISTIVNLAKLVSDHSLYYTVHRFHQISDHEYDLIRYASDFYHKNEIEILISLGQAKKYYNNNQYFLALIHFFDIIIFSFTTSFTTTFTTEHIPAIIMNISSINRLITENKQSTKDITCISDIIYNAFDTKALSDIIKHIGLKYSIPGSYGKIDNPEIDPNKLQSIPNGNNEIIRESCKEVCNFYTIIVAKIIKQLQIKLYHDAVLTLLIKQLIIYNQTDSQILKELAEVSKAQAIDLLLPPTTTKKGKHIPSSAAKKLRTIKYLDTEECENLYEIITRFTPDKEMSDDDRSTLIESYNKLARNLY